VEFLTNRGGKEVKHMQLSLSIINAHNLALGMVKKVYQSFHLAIQRVCYSCSSNINVTVL
jgi:hypothetical protein